MIVQDVVIVGAGPAGIACAIQLKRFGISPIVLEKNEIGGLIINANKIENYLGFPKGISGIKFVQLLKKQLKNFHVEIHQEEVVDIEYKDFIFHIHTNVRTISAIKLVLATGTIPKKMTDLEIPYDAEEKVFYEVYPILENKNKKIAIIGAGDAAFDYALNLGRTNEVIILNRSKTLKCLPVLKDECDKNPNITYKSNSSIEKIELHIDSLVLDCNCNRTSKQLIVHYLLIAIGREANHGIVCKSLEKSFSELINAKQLFVIGDLQNGQYRQLSLCVGDGIKSAMEIFEEINY
jgi:thioredoxin reductase